MGQTERVTNINQVDQSGSSGQAPIAPAWHTILMILLVLGPLIQATAAERRSGGPLRAPDAVPLYLIGAVVQCIFFAFAWFGVRLRKNSLQTLIGARWSNWEQLARDIGAALAFWALWYGALSLLKLGLTAARITNAPGSGMVYPSGAFQVALWIVNAILAGIVEETVFRGYLMKQFTAWTRSTRIGIVLQAVVFGSCHAYLLGVRQMVLITASES